MSYRSRLLPYFLALLIGGTAVAAHASGDALRPKNMVWSFDGMGGSFDMQSVQRGYKVYKEVCASCHSMKYRSFRNLSEIGFSEAEIKAIAASYTIKDGPDESGEMFDRPGRPSDHFPAPFPNEKAARAANGGAFPPDLSLMVKARPDGANYIYALLTGYKQAPKGKEPPAGKFYNPYFPGHHIAMPPPLAFGGVEYSDGTEASVNQMARDVVNFMQWAAEPEMQHRKSMGLKVLIFLVIFTGFFIVAKKRIWARIEK